MRCGARGPCATRHPGGIGAPPGTTMSPCQELADDLGVALPASGLFERDALTGKRGPVLARRRKWHALLSAGVWRVLLMRYRFAT